MKKSKDAFLLKDSISTFVQPFSTDGEETKMYMSLHAQTVNVRSIYADRTAQVSDKGQNIDNAQKNNESPKAESAKSGKSFSDILSIASQNRKSVESIDAFITDTIAKVLDKITEHASKALRGQYTESSFTSINISVEIKLGEGETLQDAKNEVDEMLSEDGYWGVEQTSQRMFDFAHSMVGDNPAELEKAKEAVKKGFEQAKSAFGGELPQISYDTLDSAMDKFDNYIQHLNRASVKEYA
jgi:hypothetical protein